MADHLADSLPTVGSSSGGDNINIIGDPLQSDQYTVTFNLGTFIIIGFSVSLFFCVVYHTLCISFHRFIDDGTYHNPGDVNVEEGTDLMAAGGGGEHWVALVQALILGNMQGWVMVGALMEEAAENAVVVEEMGRGENLRAMKKLPALVKYGSEEMNGNNYDDDDNKVRRNCEECVICLEDFKVGEMCQIFPRCNHVFHANCIDCWLATKLTCPTCRTYIT